MEPYLNSEPAPTRKRNSPICLCRTRPNLEWDVLERLLLGLDIGHHDKTLVIARARQIYHHTNTHFYSVQRLYTLSKFFITTVSVINPALLSITSSTRGETYTWLFWVVWTLQIVVSLVTAYVTFFKWDKKYFVYMVYRQRVGQEIWMYLELTGKYSIVHPLNETELLLMHTTHQSKLRHLLMRLESLYRKIRESDYTIESTENTEHNEHDQGGVADTRTRDGKRMRQKLMAHKIDILLAALHHTTDVAKRAEIHASLHRLKELQAHNHMVDMQLGDVDAGAGAGAGAGANANANAQLIRDTSRPDGDDGDAFQTDDPGARYPRETSSSTSSLLTTGGTER
jgi:hypothetical protein